MDTKERVADVRARLEVKVSELYSDIGLVIMVSPMGGGIRAILMRPVPRGMFPISHASTHTLEGSTEDIVHGLWSGIQKRAKDEVRSMRDKRNKTQILK